MTRPVVVGVDDPAQGGRAVAWAASEAAQRGAELVLLHGCDEAGMRRTHAPTLDVYRADALRAVRELADVVRRRDPELLAVTAEVVDAEAREALVGAAAGAQLLVVGSRGSGGFPGLLVGSTSLYVAGTAACPVVVVPESRDSSGAPPADIVVGVDAKDPDEAVLDFAFEEAERRDLSLLAAHVWRYPLLSQGHAMPPVYEKGHIEAEQERLLAEVLAGRQERFPSVRVQPDSVRSSPAKELVALSDGAALVVVGRHGRPAGRLARLGSVSLAVVQHARCPVAVVPLALV